MAEMDLAEALLLQPFAPLAGSIASNIDAKKADAQGRTILCTPAPPTSTTTLQQTLIAGIAFRIGRNATGDVVEAVRVSPPILHGKKDGGEGNGDDEEEEGQTTAVPPHRRPPPSRHGHRTSLPTGHLRRLHIHLNVAVAVLFQFLGSDPQMTANAVLLVAIR